MKENAMEIWKWDHGYSCDGWFSDKTAGGISDNSLSAEMDRLNLRHLWEKPKDTFKSVTDRFCGAFSQVSGLKSGFISEQRAKIRNKLADWATSIEVALFGQFKLMEKALDDENKCIEQDIQQPSHEPPYLHLVSLGYVKQMPIASRSIIVGDNADSLESVTRTMTLRVRDFEGNPCNLIDRHMELRVVFLCHDGEEGNVSVSRARETGEYNICFKACRPGRATLSVKLHGADVAGSPCNIMVYPNKDWTDGNIVASFFGEEGSGPRQFQRPWGVGCDRQGRLLVADRTNNRVQVFRDDGNFLFEFGKKGTGPGEFQLVSAVVGAPNGDLICVDKDNHRIQVFTEEGHFKFAFGELGGKAGQFHYPWDLDVNARGEIVVTDSRNCRIQLFTATGKFIGEFGRDHFLEVDSPRGVSFISTNEVVVTDFNKHVLVVINLRTKKHRVFCREGSGAGQLKRPQGVVWHPQGFFVVGDSRNNRIQAVDRFGSMLWETNPSHGSLDKPCGVAVTKRGHVVAIDFGNNRAVILH